MSGRRALVAAAVSKKFDGVNPGQAMGIAWPGQAERSGWLSKSSSRSRPTCRLVQTFLKSPDAISASCPLAGEHPTKVGKLLEFVSFIECTYMAMESKWDEAKNQANIPKRGVRFTMAIRIFDLPVQSWLDRRKHHGEDRYTGVGEAGYEALIVVVRNHRDGRIRLISARPASRKERQRYREQIQ